MNGTKNLGGRLLSFPRPIVSKSSQKMGADQADGVFSSEY
jgi:hypothetical protein